MTKQELYDAYATKFDAVTPVSDWKALGEAQLGVQRYDVNTYKEGSGFRTYTIYVSDDGGPAEKAVVGGEDPTIETPPTFNVFDEANKKLEELVTAGTIVGFVPSGLSGDRFIEYIVYRNVAGTVNKETYIVWANPDETIGYQKVG